MSINGRDHLGSVPCKVRFCWKWKRKVQFMAELPVPPCCRRRRRDAKGTPRRGDCSCRAVGEATGSGFRKGDPVLFRAEYSGASVGAVQDAARTCDVHVPGMPVFLAVPCAELKAAVQVTSWPTAAVHVGEPRCSCWLSGSACLAAPVDLRHGPPAPLTRPPFRCTPLSL